jgi:hypothetical protein
MRISEEKMQIVIDNYFKQECDVNTSIREAFEKGFRLGVKKASSSQSEQKWIPCSKKLPDEKDAGVLKKLGVEKHSEYVFATVEVKGERMAVTACTYDGKWDWNMKYAFPDYKIVAWMPFPEPYKGESETDD